MNDCRIKSLRRTTIRSHQEVPHLFSRWQYVSRRLRRAPHVALFLDFDGTLTPLRRRPEEVWLEESTRMLLQDLARRPRLDIWVISGRRRNDLRARAQVSGVSYYGLHGWERDSFQSTATPVLPALKRARQSLMKSLNSLERIRIEDKQYSLAIHYRDAPPRVVRQAHELLNQVMDESRSQLRLLKGNKVWEILTEQITDKGTAAMEALTRFTSPVLSIYLGDDTTDEPAFACLSGGLTVRVGTARQTRAHYRLDHPDEVKKFLIRLKGILS